jgi:hypothetical protein
MLMSGWNTLYETGKLKKWKIVNECDNAEENTERGILDIKCERDRKREGEIY